MNSSSAAELHVWQGMANVFPANIAVLQDALEALDTAGEFLRSNLGRCAIFNTCFLINT